MSWNSTLTFVLGYLVTPAIAVGLAALVIHLILILREHRAARAIRSDSLLAL